MLDNGLFMEVVVLVEVITLVSKLLFFFANFCSSISIVSNFVKHYELFYYIRTVSFFVSLSCQDRIPFICTFENFFYPLCSTPYIRRD